MKSGFFSLFLSRWSWTKENKLSLMCLIGYCVWCFVLTLSHTHTKATARAYLLTSTSSQLFGLCIGLACFVSNVDGNEH